MRYSLIWERKGNDIETSRQTFGFIPPLKINSKSPLSRAGFTLVEMLVAVTIFSIIAAGVSSVFRSGLRTWRAGNQWSEENQTARNFFRTISKDLENSVNYSPEMRFEGTAQEIVFLTLVSSHDIKTKESARQLVRVVYRYAPKEHTIFRMVAGKEEGFEDRLSKKVIVAEGIGSVDFSYAFKSVYGDEGIRWKNEWKEPKDIPRGVRIRMDDFHTTVFIPTGVLGEEDAF